MFTKTGDLAYEHVYEDLTLLSAAKPNTLSGVDFDVQARVRGTTSSRAQLSVV